MLLACGGRADEDTEEPGWGRRGHRRPPLCDRSRTRRPARSAESAVAAGSPSPPRPPLLSSEEQRQVFKDSDGNTALLGHTLELTRRQKMSRTAVRSFPRSINGAWERPGPAWALGPSSFEGGHRAGREQTRPAAWKATQLPAPGERREGSRLSRRPWPAQLLVEAPGRSPGSTEAHTIGVTAALGAGTFHAGKSRLREVKTQLELHSHILRRRPVPHAAPPAPWPSVRGQGVHPAGLCSLQRRQARRVAGASCPICLEEGPPPAPGPRWQSPAPLTVHSRRFWERLGTHGRGSTIILSFHERLIVREAGRLHIGPAESVN